MLEAFERAAVVAAAGAGGAIDGGAAAAAGETVADAVADVGDGGRFGDVFADGVAAGVDFGEATCFAAACGEGFVAAAAMPVGAGFFCTAFVSTVVVGAAFFGAALVGAAIFVAAFVTGAFFATTFFGAAFFVVAFVAGAFFAAAFFCSAFFAGAAFFAAVFAAAFRLGAGFFAATCLRAAFLATTPPFLEADAFGFALEPAAAAFGTLIAPFGHHLSDDRQLGLNTNVTRPAGRLDRSDTTDGTARLAGHADCPVKDGGEYHRTVQ